ncbi:hypothetical protein [Plantactinospora sp. GCM10030261]|uniref:hypothetical protein n=1 Tax=Plantactinospora sp. GCM10030261 TaxID=3273420 RepID=UPI00360D9EF9
MRGSYVAGRAALVMVGTATAVFGFAGPARAEPVPPPTLPERTDTVAVLDRSAQSQNICFGWRLADRYRDREVSVGSNLGDGVPVDSDPQRCPRWIEVAGTVVYTSESSESEDYASLSVESSAGLDAFGMEADLGRFGLDEKAFVDDPGWAICRAATILPLLAVERELASPAPVITAEPAAAVTPLADAGSDMWRDRWGYFAGALGLLLVTGLLVAIGLVQRRKEHNRDAEAQRRLAARQRRQQRTAKDFAPGPRTGRRTGDGG